MLESISSSPKREEQVLVLAAGGLTDKEIAVRLGISPDTVGTYWRRTLAKYGAASRTEVVAKYMKERGKVQMENLEYVNECLKLIADHMIEQGRGGREIGDAILADSPDWIFLVDPAGKFHFSNRPVEQTNLQELLHADDLCRTLSLAAQGPVQTTLTNKSGEAYDVRLAPGNGEINGLIVCSARPIFVK